MDTNKLLYSVYDAHRQNEKGEMCSDITRSALGKSQKLLSSRIHSTPIETQKAGHDYITHHWNLTNCSWQFWMGDEHFKEKRVTSLAATHKRFISFKHRSDKECRQANARKWYLSSN